MMTSPLRSFLIFAVACIAGPYFHHCAGGIGASAGASEPQWIWSTAKANEVAGSRRWSFRRQFPSTKGTKAILELTADDRFEVRLNGRRVGRGNDWRQLYRYDVTALIRDNNELVIRCQNESKTPAGLVAKLSLASNEGQPTSIQTDDTWKCRIVDNVSYRVDSEKSSDWRPVLTFGEFLIAEPWGAGIKVDRPIELVSSRADRRTSAGSGDRLPRGPSDPFALGDGDRVVFLGGTLIERSQSFGFLEYALTTAFPGRQLVFRNLGWSGDTVFGESRARFGSVEDGFEHLETHVVDLEPTLIFSAYGNNEAHDGQSGIARFREGYRRLLDVLLGTGAEVVLIGPYKYQTLPPPLPNHEAYNENVVLYNEVVRQLAKASGCRFVDLCDRWSAGDPDATQGPGDATSDDATLGDGRRVTDDEATTDNGVHLNRSGYRRFARHVLKQIDVPFPKPMDQKSAVRLRRLIAEKNELYFHRWRPQNETYLFLFRKHEQGNNAVEIPQFDPLIAEKERQIRELTKRHAAKGS